EMALQQDATKAGDDAQGPKSKLAPQGEPVDAGNSPSEQLPPNEENPPQAATLEALIEDITASRVRLAAAKMRMDTDLVRPLEKKIAAAEAQRKSQLAHTACKGVDAARSEHQPVTIEHHSDQAAPAVSEDEASQMIDPPPKPDDPPSGD